MGESETGHRFPIPEPPAFLLDPNQTNLVLSLKLLCLFPSPFCKEVRSILSQDWSPNPTLSTPQGPWLAKSPWKSLLGPKIRLMDYDFSGQRMLPSITWICWPCCWMAQSQR